MMETGQLQNKNELHCSERIQQREREIGRIDNRLAHLHVKLSLGEQERNQVIRDIKKIWPRCDSHSPCSSCVLIQPSKHELGKT